MARLYDLVVPSASSQEQLKVLLVGKGSPERGGIPTFLEVLEERLVDEPGIEVSFLNLADERGRRGGSLSTANLVATLRDLRHLRRRAAGMDLVHVHSACAPTSTLLRAAALCRVARARGAATVLHVHGGLVADWLSTERRQRLARRAIGGIDQVVAVARGPAAALSRALEEDVPVVPNGVDLARFSPDTSGGRSPGEVPVVLFVGGLTPRKGVLDLLDASQRLLGEGLAHRLVLAGGTPDDGSETEQAVLGAIASAGAHVTRVGPRPNAQMAELYRGADVFCLPSWWEAQPLSLLEAMACGLPSVASDVGDVAAMTDDGRVARIVPAKDRDALTARLGELLTDGALRTRLGRDARAHVGAQYGLDAMLAAIRDRYEAAASRRR